MKKRTGHSQKKRKKKTTVKKKMLPTMRANLVDELIGDLNRHVEDVWDTMTQLAKLTRNDDDDIEENLEVMDAVDSLSFFSHNGWSTYFVDEPERDEPAKFAPAKRKRVKRRIKPYHESDPEWMKANDEAAAGALLDALSDAVSPEESSQICEEFSSGKRTYKRPTRRHRKAPKKYDE